MIILWWRIVVFLVYLAIVAYVGYLVISVKKIKRRGLMPGIEDMPPLEDDTQCESHCETDACLGEYETCLDYKPERKFSTRAELDSMPNPNCQCEDCLGLNKNKKSWH
jgi:hypothetical protein